MELNEKIKALRKERGMSQKELAKEIGVSDRTVSKWECGKGSVKIKELEKISKALRVHIDDLLPVDAVKDKAFLPCRISASPAAKATFIAAIAILSGAAAWECVLSAAKTGVDAQITGWLHVGFGLIWLSVAAALFRVKFRVENVPKFLGFGSESVRSAYSLKRVYLTAGRALCFATFLFEAAQFAGVAFIALGLKTSTAVALRAAAVAAAVFVPYLYYRASLKRICGDEKIISRVTRSEKTIDF